MVLIASPDQCCSLLTPPPTSSSPIQSPLNPAPAIFLNNICCVHPLPKDPVAHLSPVSWDTIQTDYHNLQGLSQSDPRPLAPQSPSPPYIYLLNSCFTILQTCYGFSQFSIFTHCMHIHIACTFTCTSMCLEQCKELGMNVEISRAQSLTFWHPLPLHVLLSMPGMPALLPCPENAQLPHPAQKSLCLSAFASSPG